MRKDVKIGLGIGGVLLAVLIVYLLVPKNTGTNDVAHNDESANTTDEGGAEGSAAAGASATGTSAGEEADGGAAPDTAGTTPGTGGQGNGEAVAQGQSDTAEYDTTAATTPKVDWERILVTGIVPDDAKIPLAAPGGPAPHDIFAPTPGGNAGAEPNWNPAPRPQPNPGNGVAPTTPGTQNPPTPPGSDGGTPGATAGATDSGATGVTRDHVIQQGENLSMIAAVAYGDARRYREILKANPGLDERRLRPGMRIKLPDAASLAAAQPAAARQEPKINPASEYQVAAGDSLHKIAVKLYGKSAKADMLYELNKDKIGDEPSRLKQGMVLKLPEPPAAVQSTR